MERHHLAPDVDRLTCVLLVVFMLGFSAVRESARLLDWMSAVQLPTVNLSVRREVVR